MLGDIVESFTFAMVTFVGHSLDVYNITFVVDLHVCGKRNNAMFSKRSRERIAAASPLSLFVGHFGQLVEDVGSC